MLNQQLAVGAILYLLILGFCFGLFLCVRALDAFNGPVLLPREEDDVFWGRRQKHVPPRFWWIRLLIGLALMGAFGWPVYKIIELAVMS